MSRPSQVAIASGTNGWDGRVDGNFDILLEQPVPLHIHTGDQTDLEATFPAASFDQCWVIVDHTTLGMVMYFSDGSAWELRDANKRPVTQVTGAGTIPDRTQLAFTTAGTLPYTSTLPAVSTHAGRTIIVKNLLSGSWTVDGNGAETIDGAANVVLTQYQFRALYCDGTQWLVIASN
jgi:hypothetical protein